jgi:hypothetical protein
LFWWLIGAAIMRRLPRKIKSLRAALLSGCGVKARQSLQGFRRAVADFSAGQ